MLRREFLSLAATAGISAEARPSVSRLTLAYHRHNVVYRNEHGYAAWPTTPEQTGYAIWWMEFTEGSMNRLGRQLVNDRKVHLWQAARLFTSCT